MNHPTFRKMLLFGAGRIGRSFIAPLFHQSGFHIIFVDVDTKLVNLLNQEKHYQILVKEDESKSIIDMDNFTALHLDDHSSIISEIEECEICAVSVGNRGLPSVAVILAKGIEKRFEKYPGKPLDIILAENLREAANLTRNMLAKSLPDHFPVSSYIGLVETSIGKMVPLMTDNDLKADPLQVFAESYNTLILDGKGFKNAVPDVKGLAPKNNMNAWVDRKLFIHNLGHACLAYLGYQKNPGWKYTWEALDDPELKNNVVTCMKEAAEVLMQMHPEEFTKNQLTDHINDLIYRFGNRSLGDTIFRVGCDLDRKLGPNDRLVPVVKFAVKSKLRYHNVLKAIIAGTQFDAKDEKGDPYPPDVRFRIKYGWDTARIMADHCELDVSIINECL